mmetsp:Transcript_10741/g.12381  ORF Transcript_10741/g.12381 Transcript_10741/m.12381 type:complete len:586 (+) Transcript_10741:226-1983(+)
MSRFLFTATASFAFITLFLSSIYLMISTVPVLKDVLPRDNMKELDGMHIASTNIKWTKTTNLTNVISSDDRSVFLLVKKLKEHSSRIFLDANNNTNVLLQREQLRILDVLRSHYSQISRPIQSDVVELSHCQLDKLDYSKFSSWASVILHDAWSTLEGKLKRDTKEVKGMKKDAWDDVMYLEFCLGLLEVYATHNGDGNIKICNFEKYSLNIERSGDLLSTAETTLRNVPVSHDGLPRLVFVIMAFQDADHLEVLIEACIMPYHLFIIHLERWSPPSFTDHVHRLANKYSNVVVVQFGSIIYPTDSVSTINYKIMNWLTEELKLPYNYLLTLGNAVYPLHDVEELTRYFQKTKRDIWLGGLRNNNNAGWLSWGYLERKRLIFTSGEIKYTQRTKKWKQHDFVSSIPDYIKANMTEKTNSGNQAVFSYEVVKKLVRSPQVKELFGMAKYGCCCCLEERTWIAAAHIIGYGKEAMEAASMFQVWGGESLCGAGSMKNADLRLNATICYKSEDVTKGNIFERQRHDPEDNDVANAFFHGDKLLEELRLAKERGFVFARKFKSGDSSSLELIDMIKKYIHNSNHSNPSL